MFKVPTKVRIEVYIPSWYNPDESGEIKPIESRKKRQVKNEIIKKYGAISMHNATIEGIWVDKTEEKSYYDLCRKYEVCIDPKQDLLKELEQWKEELQELFKQIEVFIVYYEVEKV